MRVVESCGRVRRAMRRAGVYVIINGGLGWLEGVGCGTYASVGVDAAGEGVGEPVEGYGV